MKPQMTCDRALACMSSLAQGEPSFTSPEVDELLKYGLILEIDSRDLETLQWLAPVLEDHAKREIRDFDVADHVKAALDHVNEQLRSDWFRMVHRHSTLAAREQDRQDLRRAYGIVSAPGERERLVKLVDDARANRDPTFAACPALGREQYALTLRGRQVATDLQLKLSRYGSFPFATFMKAFDKADAKMAALVKDVETLHRSVNGSAKHPHQVVIGLVKSGLPPDQAVHSYASAMRKNYDPGAAVTVARNAAAHGGAHEVEQRLKAAEQVLHSFGIPLTQVSRAAAKSLLPYDRLADGATRFKDFARRLQTAQLTSGDFTYKIVPRLMPANGTPDEVMRRVKTAFDGLPAKLDPEHHVTCAAQLAAMTDDEQVVTQLANRLTEIVKELVHRKLYRAPNGVLDALECVGCAGTPAEVVETVVTLYNKLGGASQVTDRMAVAVAFAKRFTY
jgi:hypothetical protein